LFISKAVISPQKWSMWPSNAFIRKWIFSTSTATQQRWRNITFNHWWTWMKCQRGVLIKHKKVIWTMNIVIITFGVFSCGRVVYSTFRLVNWLSDIVGVPCDTITITKHYVWTRILWTNHRRSVSINRTIKYVHLTRISYTATITFRVFPKYEKKTTTKITHGRSRGIQLVIIYYSGISIYRPTSANRAC